MTKFQIDRLAYIVSIFIKIIDIYSPHTKQNHTFKNSRKIDKFEHAQISVQDRMHFMTQQSIYMLYVLFNFIVFILEVDIGRTR